MPHPDMTGQVCLVTGATAGIGQETALGLARLGATVALVARDRAKGEATRDAIRAQTGNPNVHLHLADLSSQAAIRALATEVLAANPQLHVLVNNAGGVFNPRETTVDGLERTFAVNHMAYFLLTQLLLDRLAASAPARIINVSSEAQAGGRMDFDDLQGERSYDVMRAYAQSKLANVLFTYELARRLEGTGVTANALHPGLVASNFASETKGWFGWVAKLLYMTPLALTPEQGAATSIYLASDPEVAGVTGKFFDKCKARPSSKASYDEASQRRLWEASEGLLRVPV